MRSPSPNGPTVLYSFLGVNNAFDGSVLDLPLPEGKNHIHPVQSFRQNGGNNQLWTITPGHDIPTFVIVSRANRRVLDVPGFNATDNSPINQYLYNGGANQVFEFIRVGTAIEADDHPTGVDADSQPQVGQTYYIRALCNGKFLTVEIGIVNDQPVWQSSRGESWKRQWQIEAGQNDSFRFRNRETGRYISSPDSNDAGVPVLATLQGTDPRQEWWPKRVDTLSVVPGIVG